MLELAPRFRVSPHAVLYACLLENMIKHLITQMLQFGPLQVLDRYHNQARGLRAVIAAQNPPLWPIGPLEFVKPRLTSPLCTWGEPNRPGYSDHAHQMQHKLLALTFIFILSELFVIRTGPKVHPNFSLSEPVQKIFFSLYFIRTFRYPNRTPRNGPPQNNNPTSK